MLGEELMIANNYGYKYSARVSSSFALIYSMHIDLAKKLLPIDSWKQILKEYRVKQ